MPSPDDPVSEHDVEVLTTAQLDYFRAEPSRIDPFDKSTLSWRVVQTVRGGTIELNGRRVDDAGTLEVSPSFTKTWALRVRAHSATRMLGQATVTVDLAECVTLPYGNIAGAVDASLRAMVASASEPGLKFRSRVVHRDGRYVSEVIQPQVDVTSRGIEIKLALEVIIEGENPTLDIHAVFGFQVKGGSPPGEPLSRFGYLAPVFSRLDASADFDESWLIPGALIGLPLAQSAIEKKAKERVRANVQSSANRLTDAARNALPSRGKRMHSVRIDDSLQSGTVEITVCPDPTLQVIPVRTPRG